MKLLHQITFQEHPDRGLARVVVRELEIDERETVQVVAVRGRNLRLDQLPRGLVARRRVVREALQGDLLLRHQLAGVLVHLRVVDAQPAEDGERLEERHVAVREGGPVRLVDQLRHPYHGLLAVDDGHAEDGPGGFRVPLAVLLAQPGAHVADVEDLARGCGVAGDLGQGGGLQVEGGRPGD